MPQTKILTEYDVPLSVEVAQIISTTETIRLAMNRIATKIKSVPKLFEFPEQWQEELVESFKQLIAQWRDIMKTKKQDMLHQLIHLIAF